MEILPKDAILEYNENTLGEIRKLYDLDKPGVMESVVNILENWVKMQTHFEHKDFDRRYLETTIIVSKGSIEKAKSRLDRGCTLRTLMPHIFGIHDIRHLYKTQLKAITHVLLPKMTDDYTRVAISRIMDNIDNTAFPNYLCALTFPSEYLRRNDYAKTYDLILDLADANLLEVVKAIKTSTLQDMLAYCLDCCGFRVKGIYVISSSKLIEMAVTVAKHVLGAKVGRKLHVLENRQRLSDVFNKDILPKDYGGNEKSMEELHEQWLDVLTSEAHTHYMKQMNSARTDETRRQSAKFNEEYLGMPGSFRKLDVD